MKNEHVQLFECIVTEQAALRKFKKEDMVDYLFVNMPLLATVFVVLIEQGVTVNEIREQLVLSGAKLSPQYEF
jgi:hypothetical protein